jgi:hypothetical protein
MRRLTRRQRVAVELHYYGGLSVAECAQVMSCAEGTVMFGSFTDLPRIHHRLVWAYRAPPIGCADTGPEGASAWPKCTETDWIFLDAFNGTLVEIATPVS